MFVRAYLRASTGEQDAHRARARLDAFADEHEFSIAARYVENESGAKLTRPELFRLLADCAPGDVLLTEQVDRLSRLTEPDWRQLRAEIEAKQVRIVALDLPTSWGSAAPSDDFTGCMFVAVNAMMLDVLAAVAARITRTAAGAKPKASARPRPPASTRAGGRTRLGTKLSPPCSRPAPPGSRSRRPWAAAGGRSRKSVSD